MLTRLATRLLVAAGTALAVTAVVATPPALAAAGQRAEPAAGNPAGGASALRTELPAAWRMTQGRGVTVAVLDSGVDPVQQLAGRLTQGPDYAPLPHEDKSSGTTLAAGIAGSGSTSAGAFGQIGRAPQARILSVRVTGGGEAGSSRYLRDGVWQDNEARGIRYAVLHGAQVITIETAGYDDTAQLQQAVSFAVARGAVLITSSPRFGSSPNDVQYPAALPGVVNVSYLTLTGAQSPSGHERPAAANTSVLLTAPANDLPVDGPAGSSYVMFNSESALAWVAGTAALIKSKYPRLLPALVVRALAQSAQDATRGGYSTATGFGLINPLGALTAAGRLAGLGQTVGTPRSGVQVFVPPSNRFWSLRLPAIVAVHHAAGKLDEYYGLIGLGAVLFLAGIAVLARRPRVRSRANQDVVSIS
jgi:hypothetical protein